VAKRQRRRADEPVDGGLVLDAGALQALERRHVRLLVDLRRAHDLGLKIRIPAGALAQSWRGGPRSASIARLLKQSCDIVQVDERSAREIGEFIATLQPDVTHPDIVDAHVALVTRRTGSLVWTSDPDDMRAYLVDSRFIRAL
jgi:predicted nucleic acid-binding protein